MKKKNFIVGFSAAFTALLALVSCGSLRGKDGVVLTINGKEYTAEELFNEQKTPAAAEAKFNAVYKVAVRKYFDQGQSGNQYMEEITRETKNKIAGSKAEANSNASKNGTSYDTEWNKILKSNNVDDEAGLYDKYEYDLQKSKFEDVFYENNYDVLRAGGYFHDKGETKTDGVKLEKGYLENKQPYHMKHILVKVSAKDKDNTTGEITEKEAQKLYDVITSLAKGTSFDAVSQLYNDDETAKKNHGSLGIMSRDTSFVNDFKLGTYMYEAFFGSSTQDSTKAYKSTIAKTALGLDESKDAGKIAAKIAALIDPTTSTTVETVTTGHGIGQIPYGEVLKLASSKVEPDVGVGDLDFTNNKIKENFSNAGLTSSDVKAKYFPRNVIFNKYFNKHNIMVITPTDAPSLGDAKTYLQSKDGVTTRTKTKDVYNGNESTSSKSLSGFKFKTSPTVEEKEQGYKEIKNDDEVKINNESKTVLRDNNGRVILVFRSGSGSSNSSNADSGYQGIHFVVIERSPFINEETDTFIGDDCKTNLEEYYTEYFPKQSDSKHPKYANGTYKYTYTNYIMNETEIANQKARADTVKSELKKADDNLNTYIYDYLISKGDIKFSETAKAKNIQDSINNWIKLTKREATAEETEKKWVDTWQTYYDSLNEQMNQRTEYTGESGYIVSRLIPEICVSAFKNEVTTISDGSTGTKTVTLKDLFGVGGVFHD